MDFIITSISQPLLLLPASKAFLEVCNHCKKSLVNFIDALVNIYMQLPDSIVIKMLNNIKLLNSVIIVTFMTLLNMIERVLYIYFYFISILFVFFQI